MKTTKELRSLAPDVLVKRLGEFKKDLFTLRSKSATGSAEDSGKIRTLKRNIARVKTLMRESELKSLTKKQEVEKK